MAAEQAKVGMPLAVFASEQVLQAKLDSQPWNDADILPLHIVREVMPLPIYSMAITGKEPCWAQGES